VVSFWLVAMFSPSPAFNVTRYCPQIQIAVLALRRGLLLRADDGVGA